MKHILFFTVLLLFCVNLFSQDCDLSSEARKHWLRAEAAMETITDESDYLLAATELEKVLQLAPDCADVLYNLGLVYSQIGTYQGRNAFDKAEQYLKRYIFLNPSGKQEAEDLLVKLEFKREKYREKKNHEPLTLEESEQTSYHAYLVTSTRILIDGTWKANDFGLEPITIKTIDGEIWITVIKDNRGNKETVKGYVSNGLLKFEYKYSDASNYTVFYEIPLDTWVNQTYTVMIFSGFQTIKNNQMRGVIYRSINHSNGTIWSAELEMYQVK